MLKFSAAAVALVVTAAVCVPACRSDPGGPIDIHIASPGAIVVSGLSSAEARALADAEWSSETWQRLLQVRVRGAQDAMAGTHAISDGRLEFRPAFPLDAGRDYDVTLNLDLIPVRRVGGIVARTVALPAPDRTPVTRVTDVHPAATAWPANLLRAYIHFSGAMSRDGGLPHIRLVDDRGQEVEEVFLPLEADFWNADHTRYTVFFDPGRVKRGILPNRQHGRALVPGRTYALVIDAAWRDALGRPLVGPYRHEFLAGPEIEAPLSVADWRVQVPAAGARQPLTVEFPWLIDRGLAERSFAMVGPDGRPIGGVQDVAGGDRRWIFTPRDPWVAGEYRLTALPILEDPAGNQIGRAFEVDMKVPPAAVPDAPHSRAFRIQQGMTP